MLAIVGSGEYLPPMNEVDRQLIDLFDTPPRVACLPTAAGTEGDVMIDDWMQRGVDHFTSLGVEADGVRVWDDATANDPAFAERIAAADFVYLSGGKPGYLMSTLTGTRAWNAISDVIERGGLLAGCSAGAMIQGER
ncbi:MAG: Type 1 glutamine amidotransferase-like domain-containing protein, partial [Actinomycetota bacterium]